MRIVAKRRAQRRRSWSRGCGEQFVSLSRLEIAHDYHGAVSPTSCGMVVVVVVVVVVTVALLEEEDEERSGEVLLSRSREEKTTLCPDQATSRPARAPFRNG